MAISLNRLIKVLPSVIKAAGDAINLNGVILADNSYLPIGKALPFTSADTVLAAFGSASNEYKAALTYFNGPNNKTSTPAKLFFARFNATDSNAALIGANLNITLVQLKALSGTIILSINGVSKTATVDLSKATSFSNAATLIAAQLTGTEVVYNEITKQYKITVTGSKATDTEITLATGTIADALGLTSASGGVVSKGALATNASDLFTWLNASTLNWYSFTTLQEATDAQHLDLASWVNGQDNRFAYIAWTSSGTAQVSGNQDTILAQIDSASYGNVCPIYAPDSTLSAAVMGYCASLDFNRNGGKVQAAYRQFSGITPNVESNTNYDALTDNGYNFYGAYAANIDTYPLFQSGRITGDFMWLDNHAAQAWLNANVQLMAVTLLMGNSNIPYDAVGRQRFETVMVTPLERFKSWGGCVTGTDLDNNQILQITQLLGVDKSQALVANGYVIHVGEFTSTMRANRTTPPIYILYANGGAFRTLTINSVEVQ